MAIIVYDEVFGWGGDTAAIQAAGRADLRVQHLGFGDFEVEGPDGPVEFRRGVVTPPRPEEASGRWHGLYGEEYAIQALRHVLAEGEGGPNEE